MNAFAHWVTSVRQEEAFGEQCAAVDTESRGQRASTVVIQSRCAKASGTPSPRRSEPTVIAA
jgi:hypothetical protein